jgi:hypothetical protein
VLMPTWPSHPILMMLLVMFTTHHALWPVIISVSHSLSFSTTVEMWLLLLLWWGIILV